MGWTVNAGFADRPHVETPFGFAYGRDMRLRRLAHLALHLCGNIINRIANCHDRVRMRSLELGPHGGRGCLQQLQKILARKVAALAQRQCQPPVIPRTGGQLAITGKREPGTFIPYDLVHHPIVAAVDKNIRDGLAEFQALRDRKKMVLTLGGRVFNQIIVTQLLRMNEYRPGHLDLVIKCERTNELWRGAAHAGQPLREFCARFDLDIGGEPAQHIIEQ